MESELRRVARAIGVTRVARVTGLDRAGVEVACAVRPLGHVLQVCNGKGESEEQAHASALGEAAELWGAERVEPAQFVVATARELGARAFNLGEQSSAGALIAPRLRDARVAWRPARDLFSGESVLVPAQAVHCPPAGAPLGPAIYAWSSNGMGAHADPARALLHALLEAAERDGLARALPRGWALAALEACKIDPASLAKAAPRAAALRERLARAGLTAHLFGLAPRRWLGLPLAGALLADEEQGPLPLTAGYACALSADDALTSALLEAAQSRLTDIHGARDDVTPPDRAASLALSRAASAAPSRIILGDDPVAHAPAAGRRPPGHINNVHMVLERYSRFGFSRIASADLAPPGFPLAIVKVLIPGMRVSELL